MPRPLRLLGLTALALVLLILPVGTATMALALALAVDATAVLLVLRRHPVPVRPSVVLAVGGEGGSVYLLRRTVPGLRMRRPDRVVEAQTRWRRASEARRRGRVQSQG